MERNSIRQEFSRRSAALLEWLWPADPNDDDQYVSLWLRVSTWRALGTAFALGILISVWADLLLK